MGRGYLGGYLTVGGTMSLGAVAGLYERPFLAYFCLGGIQITISINLFIREAEYMIFMKLLNYGSFSILWK